jgi:hypothetical protein
VQTVQWRGRGSPGFHYFAYSYPYPADAYPYSYPATSFRTSPAFAYYGYPTYRYAYGHPPDAYGYIYVPGDPARYRYRAALPRPWRSRL